MDPLDRISGSQVTGHRSQVIGNFEFS